TMVL
ncbi:hypothetical protein AB1N83_007112, partial [Pleurotus pulmonarius]